MDKLRATIHSLKEELQESEDEIEWLDRALMELQQQHALTQLQLQLQQPQQQQQQKQLTSIEKKSVAFNVPVFHLFLNTKYIDVVYLLASMKMQT